MPKFEKTGENEHGYPIYERVQKPATEKQPQKRAGMTRRSFLAGAASTGLSMAAIGGAGWYLHEKREREKGLSKHFLAAIAEYKEGAMREATEESLLAQFNPTEEAELVERIKNGEVRTTIDVAEHFGKKPVVGAEKFSRIEYVQSEMVFKKCPVEGRDREWEHVQEELRKVMPGLCAQESRFDNNSVSSVGARGIFQFMPDTWSELQEECRKEDVASGIAEPTLLDMRSLKDQTRAAGKHFSNIYKRLYHYSGPELDHIQDTFFRDGGFERFFLVPLMINSYNAGSKRLSDAVVLLASEFDTPTVAREVFDRDIRYLGYDVFFDLAEKADESKQGTLSMYDTHASEYVPRVYAMMELLRERSNT